MLGRVAALGRGRQAVVAVGRRSSWDPPVVWGQQRERGEVTLLLDVLRRRACKLLGGLDGQAGQIGRSGRARGRRGRSEAGVDMETPPARLTEKTGGRPGDAQ